MDGSRAGAGDDGQARRRRALGQRLESLAAAGVEALPKRRVSREPTVVPERVTAALQTQTAYAPADRGSRLAVIRAEVEACTLCVDLAAARTRTVFGTGSATARICFFGEAPGADEDASGEPFVGRAGQLLTRIISSIGLSRDEVYILNVLKCRPPGNRTPLPDEVANCRGYFERQFATIAPEFVCCLGTSASHALLRTDEPIGKLRGRWFAHGGAQVLCTYHPSYLLRNPSAKRQVWEDMQLLAARAGLELPPRGD